MPPKGMSPTGIQKLVVDKVAKALAADRATRNNMDVGGRSGGNGGQGGTPPVQECSFAGFMKCGPTQFHGNEGAIELCRWFEKIENVFGISECAERSKVKCVVATLQGRALTWWNAQVATLGLDVANRKSWTDMRKMMMEELCPNEELALLCPEAVPTEKKKGELYIKGFPKNMKGETTSSMPAVLNDTVCMAHTLMELKIQDKAKRIAKSNKRKWESNNNQVGDSNNNRNNNYHNNNRGNHCDNNRHN
ncbi:hypothetical protein Tco_0335638 [Tanacetum coccineum]